ncbi:helix-turn-helix domain-containing protein [Thermodesulfobacteriota bacterium]
MNKHLRNYCRAQRERKGVRLGELAELVGYRNRSKGAQRILAFEREGDVDDDFLQKLCEALELDPDGVREAMEKDVAEWEEWLNEPVPMRMIVRIMVTVYSPQAIPPEITSPEEAVSYACSFAREKKLNVCLVLSRKESVWIGSDGEVTNRTFTESGLPNSPFATLGGKRRFLFNTEGGRFHPVVLKGS